MAVEFDIKGNQARIIDAMGRTVMQYEYDMLGNRIRQYSMDSGQRLILYNVIGKPFYRWTAFVIPSIPMTMPCTAVRKIFLRQGDEEQKLVEEIIYGEVKEMREIIVEGFFNTKTGLESLHTNIMISKVISLRRQQKDCQRLQNHLGLE